MSLISALMAFNIQLQVLKEWLYGIISCYIGDIP